MDRRSATIQKYVHDLTALSGFLAGRPVSKGALLEWKEDLIGQYAPASVNSMLAAVNGFLSFCGLNELRLRKLKIQKTLFLTEDKELTKAEYVRLVRAAERTENERLSLVIQTICAASLPAPITAWSAFCPGWRTSWATAASPPPGSTQQRAAIPKD